MSDKRLQALREDLQVAITQVETTPGSILVIHPKDDRMQFTPHYAEWLSETLRTIMPPGVRALILSDALTQFNVEEPRCGEGWSSQMIQYYTAGWNDAFAALQQRYSKTETEQGGENGNGKPMGPRLA